MRYMMGIAAALVLAGGYANTAAAQVDAHPRTLATAPLPAALVPKATPWADIAARPSPAWRFVRITGIGALAGAGAGLVIGAITTDGCQPDEDWCILGWEGEVAIHGVAGAMVGAGIGAVYGLVSTPRYRNNTRPAPVAVVPMTDGVRVGLTLRH